MIKSNNKIIYKRMSLEAVGFGHCVRRQVKGLIWISFFRITPYKLEVYVRMFYPLQSQEGVCVLCANSVPNWRKREIKANKNCHSDFFFFFFSFFIPFFFCSAECLFICPTSSQASSSFSPGSFFSFFFLFL